MEKEQKTALIRIGASAMLLIVFFLLPLKEFPKWILYLIPYAIVGWDVVWEAIRGIFKGKLLDEHFLMSVVTIGAFVIGEYTEAVFVMLFYQFGEMLQDLAVDRSRKSISEMMDLRPDTVEVERDGNIETEDPQKICLGEILSVNPGRRLSLDGVIIDGSSSVDLSALTGESIPRDVGPGDPVLAGSVNLSGRLRIRVTKLYHETTLARIIEMTEHAEEKKAAAVGFITRFSRFYTPCVVGAAVLLSILPPLLFAQPWTEWIQRGLTFLTVSCPCAFVIAIPLSFFCGIGTASRRGILIKGGIDLEKLAGLSTVVFDKTGTLTSGDFQVVAVHPHEISEDDLLRFACLAEQGSNHPIAMALQSDDITSKERSSFQEIAGLGVQAEVEDHKICIGNARFMTEIGLNAPECHRAGTIIHIAVDGDYAGHIVIADALKKDAKMAVDSLRRQKVRRIVMLSGDKEKVVSSVAETLGIKEYSAEMLPGDKVSYVKKLMEENRGKAGTAFVGDGLNDAPVMACADLGIAMGGQGIDAAIEAADVVLMEDQPSKLAEAISIARKTMRIVRENLVFILGTKALVLILGAFGIAGLWLAIFADVGVAVLAALNALRLLSRGRPSRQKEKD